MSGPVPDSERLSRRVARDLATGAPVENADFQALRAHLVAYLRRTVPRLPSGAYEDVVDASISRFHEVAQTDRVRAATALAYLRAIARNAALDEVRYTRRFTGERSGADPEFEHADDAIAQLVDERANADIIEALLRECVLEGDRVATRVINAFLNLAEDLGATPSERKVAQRAQVSHTTVQNVLRRLRERLDGLGLP